METLYNLDKTPSAEPSLKGNIVPDAKRPENFTSLPWRAQSDSLWGHLPYSSVHRFKEISLRQQFKAIPETNQSSGHSGHHQSSRSVKTEDVLFTQTSY